MEKVSQDDSGSHLKKSDNSLSVVSSTILPYRLDFRMDIAHSLASRSYTVNIGVIVESDSGLRGYGECVPRLYVTGETPQSVIASLDTVMPSITAKSFASPRHIVDLLEHQGMSANGSASPAAQCALELALLDLAGKHWNAPVSDLLGFTVSSEPLTYSLVVPLLSVKAVEKFLEHAASFDFKHIKVKVDAEDSVGYVRRIRSLLGDDVEIRVDANCSWNRADAAGFMGELADLGVVSVEQPLSVDDLEGMAGLRMAGMPLIILDESVQTVEDVNHAAEAGACDIVNVRISKCGGILGAKRIVETAFSHGLEVQLGAHVGESCILSAAGAHLASAISRFRWLEGCFGTHLLKRDLCEESFQFGYGGRLQPPVGPGLGVKISEPYLEEIRVDGESLI